MDKRNARSVSKKSGIKTSQRAKESIKRPGRKLQPKSPKRQAKPAEVNHVTILPEVISRWQEEADIIVRMTDVSACLILEAGKNMLSIVVSSGDKGEFYKKEVKIKTALKNLIFSRTQKGQLTKIPNAANNQDQAIIDKLPPGIKSYTGMPLYLPNDNLYGILSIFDSGEEPLDEDTGKLLRLYASIIEDDLRSLYFSGNRIKSEKEQQENKEKFYEAFHSNPAIMTISTLKEGRFIEVNDAFLETFEFNREEVIGSTSKELKIFQDYSHRQKIVQQAISEGFTASTEVPIRTKSGRQKIGLFSADIVHLLGIEHLLIIMNDITDRKITADALREIREEYRILFQKSNDAILIHDLEGSIFNANIRATELFGYELSDILSMSISQLHPIEELEAYWPALEALKKNESITFEIAFIKKDDIVFPSEVSASLFEINGHKVIQSIVRDITLRKLAEHELKDAYSDLQHEREELNKKNIALQEVLGQVEAGKKQIAKQLRTNVEKIVLPSINRLIEKVGQNDRENISQIVRALEDITSPFINGLEAMYARLSPRELEICKMIKNGLSSKEIALALNTSLETVRFQRKSIRKKIGITDRKVSLRSYLEVL